MSDAMGTGLLDETASTAIKRCLKRGAPYINAGILMPSRRGEGLLCEGGEARAYASVDCYVQRGLGGRVDVIRTVINSVMRFQRDADAPEHVWSIVAFGSTAEDYSLTGRFNVPKKCLPTRSLSEQIGRKVGTSPSQIGWIPKLLRSPPTEGLVIIICNGAKIVLKEPVRMRLTGRKPRTKPLLWAFLHDDGYVWQFGGLPPLADDG